ncbi:unnamed protein product [Prorocentrum cordatum]|uniref:Uncharacterized protein n=1 Tax=Prorocentrum cordatum TaxID=2364126 RepID=A0ABN9TAK4_9DINO|nr:unnamed protein product [Polarella glacialis]
MDVAATSTGAAVARAAIEGLPGRGKGDWRVHEVRVNKRVVGELGQLCEPLPLCFQAWRQISTAVRERSSSTRGGYVGEGLVDLREVEGSGNIGYAVVEPRRCAGLQSGPESVEGPLGVIAVVGIVAVLDASGRVLQGAVGVAAAGQWAGHASERDCGTAGATCLEGEQELLQVARRGAGGRLLLGDNGCESAFESDNSVRMCGLGRHQLGCVALEAVDLLGQLVVSMPHVLKAFGGGVGGAVARSKLMEVLQGALGECATSETCIVRALGGGGVSAPVTGVPGARKGGTSAGHVGLMGLPPSARPAAGPSASTSAVAGAAAGPAGSNFTGSAELAPAGAAKIICQAGCMAPRCPVPKEGHPGSRSQRGGPEQGSPSAGRYSQLADSSGAAAPAHAAAASSAASGSAAARGAAPSAPPSAAPAAGARGHGGGSAGWGGPLAVFLAASFLQTAGLYLGTACYVRWMDVLSAQQGLFPQAGAGGPAAGGPPPATREEPWPALDDPVVRRFRGLVPSGADSGPLGAEFWVGVLTGAVPVVWLGWVVQSQNLQLWAKVLISGAVLAAINGFSAWATMVPDPSGWEACKERLGPGGLMNYRVFSAGSNQGGEQADLSQVATDLLMLEVRGLWLMGRQSRHYTCVGTMFSATSCYCVLFALGLYDVVRSLLVRGGEARRRAERHRPLSGAGRGHRRVLLHRERILLHGGDRCGGRDDHIGLRQPRGGRGGFELDQRPRAGASGTEAVLPGHRPQQPQLPMPIGRTEVSTDTMASMDVAGNVVGPLVDVAEVTVAPCCVPFCSLGGLYYLREAPGAATGRPWTAEAAQVHLQQQSDYSRQRERLMEQLKQLTAELEHEQLRARERETQRAEAERRHLEQLAQRLAEEEKSALEEAAGLLDAARLRRAEAARRAAGAAGRLGSLEAELAESRQAILRCHDEVTRRTAEALESVASLSAEAGEAERELALLAEAAGPAEAEKEKPPPDGPDEAPALPEPEKPEPTPDPE